MPETTRCCMASGEQTTDPRPWWLRLWCRLLTCTCVPYSDEGGCGGQCVRCGRVVGYVTRAQLRAYADREMRRAR
jgi:hypothetical protein